MLIMDGDVHVHFKTAEDKESIEMQLSIDNDIQNLNFLKLINKPVKLKHVIFVDFKDENKTHNDSDRIDVKFLSKGSYMSKGIMRLSNYKINETGSFKKYICLPGYPKPLYLINDKNGDPACDESKQNEFNQRLINYTLSEIDSKKEKVKVE